MESKMVDTEIIVVTDHVFVRQSEISYATKIVKKEGFEQFDPLIITQAASQHQLPAGSSSMDTVVVICKSSEFPSDDLFKDISRVLKPGGTIVVYSTSQSTSNPNLERKLLLAGFLYVKPCEIGQPIGIIGKKPSWKIGSSFSIKKATLALPKVLIEDEMDLIDEDSLLTEDDLKKPQLPPVGDCEVGSTRKACKNCTCGRAEAEKKVKLGLTMDQLNNPQSACGNCGLGDAFRCSTCPYKGLPPFKSGEKVTLSGNFLTADI